MAWSVYKTIIDQGKVEHGDLLWYQNLKDIIWVRVGRMNVDVQGGDLHKNDSTKYTCRP